MRQALTQAKKAYAHNEVPIGAVVVNNDGVVIGRGYNQIEKKNSQAAHAEITAITRAGKKIGNWRLNGCWLYVTLEPCSTCMNLAIASRLDGIIYGATSPLFGYQLDNNLSFQLYKVDAPLVIGGIEEKKAAELLKKFFREKRILKKGKVNDDNKSKGT